MHELPSAGILRIRFLEIKVAKYYILYSKQVTIHSVKAINTRSWQQNSSKESEYDQQMPQSQTTDQPKAT